MNTVPIFVFSGPPSAGKPSVATTLMQRFQFGVHILIDDLREWVVAWGAHPENWTNETTRQFSLARAVAAHAETFYMDTILERTR